MNIDVTCDNCVHTLAAETGLDLGQALQACTVTLDLTTFEQPPTTADIHAYMWPAVLAATISADATPGHLNVHTSCPPNGITLHELHSNDWYSLTESDIRYASRLRTNDEPSRIAWLHELAEFVEAKINSNTIEEFFQWCTLYVSCGQEDVYSLEDRWMDAYNGTFDNPAAYAEYIHSELNSDVDMSRWPYCYIDWSEAARHLELDGSAAYLELDNGNIAVINPAV